jgi:hypothetical protein
MPWGLERWHGDTTHFITFSCYRRQALLSNAHRRELFLKVLEDVRPRYQWVVIGYVVIFPALMLRPGLETRETRGTRPSPLDSDPSRAAAA